MQSPPVGRILFVDDEPNLLAAMTRTLRTERFQISTAPGGAEALELLRNSGPYAVIVSDLRMPNMDGVTLLRKARELSPSTVRVLFTGQLDMDKAIAAVNDGAIFRFMLKPCASVVMALTLDAAIEQYRLITVERDLLERTLHGSIKALTDILALTSPMAFGRATRLQDAMRSLAAHFGVADAWQVEVAAMLSQIGTVTLPPATLERLYQGEELNEQEKEMVSRLPAIAEKVLGHIPRLEPVLDILSQTQKRFANGGAEPIPWGARALKILLDLDALESEGMSAALAFDTLRGREGAYDPAILSGLASIRNHQQSTDVRELPLDRLQQGMVIAQDVRLTGGVLFAARGQEITASLLEKLRNFSSSLQSKDTIRVIVGRVPEEPVRATH